MDAPITHGGAEPETVASFSRWERLWAWAERWLPHVLLLVASVPALTMPGRSAEQRAGILGLACLGAVWVAAGYALVNADRDRRRGWAAIYLVGLLAIAAVLMTADQVFFVFAITGFLHAVLLRPWPLVFLATGATSFLILAMTWEGGFPQPTAGGNAGFLTVLVLQTALIGGGLVSGDVMDQLMRQRKRTVEQLQATLAENEGLHAQLLVQAREAGVTDERQRMAREIHDTLAQGFTGIITQLEAARQTPDDPVALQRRLDAAVSLARRSLTEARRSVHALGPGALEQGRLVDALHELGREWSELTGIEVELAANGDHLPLAAHVEVALLRVAQEALNNVAKHAAASRVRVSLSHLDDRVLLDVRDDGRGMDGDGEDRPGTDPAMGYGITSMRQRMEHAGGTLTIESEPGEGTAVSAQVPITEEPEDA